VTAHHISPTANAQDVTGTDAPLSVADVLDRAAEKLEAPGAWLQGEAAESADGFTVLPKSSDAVCWCVMGAVWAVTPNKEIGRAARDVLAGLVGTPLVSSWNDAIDRTQPEVVAALRRAATLARGVQS
jgi:hypothetical protein